jgi:hypothetical protein
MTTDPSVAIDADPPRPVYFSMQRSVERLAPGMRTVR